jgi:hypothetical protein
MKNMSVLVYLLMLIPWTWALLLFAIERFITLGQIEQGYPVK